MSTTYNTQTETEHETEELESLYEKAKGVSLDAYLPAQARTLATETYREVTGDRFSELRVRIAELYGYGSDEPLECLLVHPNGVRQFVGEDDTATNAGRFSFVIDPREGDPPVRTIEEALDLLRPPEVDQAVIATDAEPGRQGEWWIIPSDEVPAGSEFNPGVGSRPYGGSPLENHVPREYGLGVADDEFMDRFEELTGIEKEALQTPYDVFDWVWKQRQFLDDDLIGVPENIPTVRELRDLADGIYVKGTLRHRENDHYLTSIGEEWRLAVTHEVEVFTPTAPGEEPDWIYQELDSGYYHRVRNPAKKRPIRMD